MDKSINKVSLWDFLENIIDNLKSKRLADVFRFISFYPNETYGPHNHLRIEINYVKKGSCFIHKKGRRAWHLSARKVRRAHRGCDRADRRRVRGHHKVAQGTDYSVKALANKGKIR